MEDPDSQASVVPQAAGAAPIVGVPLAATVHLIAAPASSTAASGGRANLHGEAPTCVVRRFGAYAGCRARCSARPSYAGPREERRTQPPPSDFKNRTPNEAAGTQAENEED